MRPIASFQPGCFGAASILLSKLLHPQRQPLHDDRPGAVPALLAHFETRHGPDNAGPGGGVLTRVIEATTTPMIVTIEARIAWFLEHYFDWLAAHPEFADDLERSIGQPWEEIFTQRELIEKQVRAPSRTTIS